jgi:hypothetical protein
MPSTHELSQLARRIHAAYEQRAAQSLLDQQTAWNVLQQRCRQARRQRRLIEEAWAHGTPEEAQLQQQKLQTALRAVTDALRLTQERMLARPFQAPSLKNLVAELRSLDNEFDHVVFDRKDFLAVQTAPIVLEEIHLGRFSLRLHWPRLAHRADVGCIDIVALDPNPAGENEDVPHPHVRDGQLCAGEATLPLKKALEEGRLIDAFHMIRSVLETYNPDSAHVSLSQWDGFSCWGCGSSTDRDESYFCESCAHDVCSDCTSFCKECDLMRCTSCQPRCDVCNEPYCRNCLTKSACSDLTCCKDCLRACAVCSAEVAPDELDEETKRCPACRDKPVITETAEPESETASALST